MDNMVNASTLIPHILQYEWRINSDATVYNKQTILAINLEMIYLWGKCCFTKYGTNYLQFASKNFSQQKITFCGFKVFPWMNYMSKSMKIVNFTHISFYISRYYFFWTKSSASLMLILIFPSNMYCSKEISGLKGIEWLCSCVLWMID